MVKYQLGRWDLSELAKNPKSQAFQKQILELENLAKKFEKIKLKLVWKNYKNSSSSLKYIHTFS